MRPSTLAECRAQAEASAAMSKTSAVFSKLFIKAVFFKKISTAFGGIFFLALPCPGFAPLARRGKACLTYMKGLISNK
jgi:hypothetical protein